ncbi:hypothetical protein TRFO_01775 [Tritrichomonas foetus]|uniref:Protein kinase domain-containing protein n=1 Tax=Tritrichomonas foetus TaxID=1144522 RepID=A0A1J4JUG3_9EUKA|nr:hypothetical protein TRFO_01775 [Tritrichomonas foetus]|eukprot:OHT01158.1 hypothetical protein TRFO_01775 [Tritrichomonas foetus]
MSNQRLIQVASQLISAVSYAHTQKVAHLDIKPPNVLFNEFGHVALVDFGISQIGQSLTKNNACTIAYAPPEIVNKSAGTPIDPFKADSWSVGITLLEFALGKYPLPLSNERELINSISAAKFSIPPSLPPALQSIIARCLIPNPSTRISMLQAEKEILASLKISGTYSIKTMTLNGKAIGQIIRERSSTNLIDADSSGLHTNLFTSGMNTGTTGSAGSSKKFPVALTNMGTKVTYPGTNGLPTKKPISMSTTKMILSRSAMGGLTRQGASQTKFRATPITIPNVIH